MKFKTKICIIEIDTILTIVIITSIISNKLFNFLYYFFACYLFIFFHELMHILVGNILNKKLIRIRFSIAGVCATFEKRKYTNNRSEYLKNVFIYIAGPISNIILAYLFNSNRMIKEINIFLAILNLLPIFPLDGYNILINMIKVIFVNKNSLKIVNYIGNLFILLLLLISIYQIILYYNFSMFIFCVYVFVLKISKNK